MGQRSTYGYSVRHLNDYDRGVFVTGRIDMIEVEDHKQTEGLILSTVPLFMI